MNYREPVLNDFKDKFQNEIDDGSNSDEHILIIKTANQVLQDSMKKPIPKMLFSEFWYEGELAILFASTNEGKTILAVQIADSITKGFQIKGFKMEAEAQSVLYLDFELSEKQFEIRYSYNYENHYFFDEKFLRAEINTEFFNIDNFEAELFNSIEQAIIDYQAKIIIIDNLSYLRPDSEKSKEALPLMKQLKYIKKKYDLSMLLLAHTPKRDMSKPITLNDLAGSRQIANFTDSIFAIGRSSKNCQQRYIKQIKSRSSEILYDSENVITCDIQKSTNFLEFKFLDFGYEHEHLKQRTEEEQRDLDKSIIKLKQNEPELSNAEIARRLETNRTRVGRVLKKLLKDEAQCNSP